MMHDGLMLNPARIAFTQHGAEFFGEVTEKGEVMSSMRKVFNADPDQIVVIWRPDRLLADQIRQAEEEALKQFVIWCYDRRLTPVRA